MAFNLKKVLKALLLSASEPLAIKDIQAAFTRFHDTALLPRAASDEGQPSGGDGRPPSDGERVTSDEGKSTDAAGPEDVAADAGLTERTGGPPVPALDEAAEVMAEPPPDPELYADVPSLVTGTQIREAMDAIAVELRAMDDGLLLIEGSAGYRIVTHPRFARWVRILRQEPAPVKLSQSSIETLAVVAYRQPATRGEIETIRGVSAEAGINKLLERELIYIVGRADAPGRPIQYGTTDQFLEFVGIKSLDELPASDVLSSRQIDEWLTNSSTAHKPNDADMGLSDEQLPLEGAAAGPLAAGLGGEANHGGASATPDMDLEPIRQKIDQLDKQLVELLNQRLALAGEIGKVKRSAGGQIYVAEREDAVLRKVAAHNQGPIRNEALRAIYREIMSAAIALEKPLLVAYLGPEASNTHAAALKKFGASVDYHAMATVGDIFTAVEKGETDYAVIPIENSTEGSVREALDSFVESDLKVVAQIYLEINHALISNSALEAIQRVYSKDQALAQCRHWLQRHLPHAQLVDAPSTSRAVQLAREEPGTAAIAGELAAEHYGVPIVERNIQDRADNTTRFFIIGRKPSGPVGGGNDMTSLLVSLGDEAASHSGALLKMLMPLAERGINLSKIESRPSKKRPWDYYFFLDVTGHYDDAAMKAALSELKKFCPLVKWLGSYPAVS